MSIVLKLKQIQKNTENNEFFYQFVSQNIKSDAYYR